MTTLNLIAPVNPLGYGVAGQNVSYALHDEGVEVSLFPIGPVEVEPKRLDLIQEMKANAGFFDDQAPCLKIWHQNDLAEQVGRGLKVGFPFFELDKINARESHHLRSCDRVFVSSRWAKEIVEQQVMNCVDVIPLGVDRTIFHENIQTDKLHPDYTVFVNIGKWEVRKGHDLLISAFNKAFKPTDKVMLKMLCYNPFIGGKNDEWATTYLGSQMGKNIYLSPRLTSQEAVARFMMSGDCGVFPARAEGWNLELLEMMSMGKHVITTYVTAHTEFANQKNARIIYPTEVEPAYDGIWFHGQGNWAKLGSEQEEQLIVHMREVHRLKQLGTLGKNEEGISTAKHFTWQNTAREIIKHLG